MHIYAISPHSLTSINVLVLREHEFMFPSSKKAAIWIVSFIRFVLLKSFPYRKVLMNWSLYTHTLQWISAAFSSSAFNIINTIEDPRNSKFALLFDFFQPKGLNATEIHWRLCVVHGKQFISAIPKSNTLASFRRTNQCFSFVYGHW